MGPYETLFGINQQHCSLDQVERRWAWFKRLLKYIEAKFGTIFPNHWRIPLRLCLEFIDRTKLHLIQLLGNMESSGTMDVNQLLKALQSSIRFEKEMTERFNIVSDLKKCLEAEEAKISGKPVIKDLSYNQHNKDEKLVLSSSTASATINLNPEGNKEEELESTFLTASYTTLSGGLSGSFDKFLGSYVLLERQNLEEMLGRLSQEEDTTTDDSHAIGHLYGSATNMFVFIKNNIKRCTALTTGQTFLSLSEEWRSCMQKYISMLKSRCPPELSSNPPVFRLPAGTEVNICFMINTSEYCSEVVPQLEQMVQQLIQPALASKVNFSPEVDAFMDFIAHCLKVLVFGIMDRLDPAYRAMMQINWSAFAQVGEESSYLHTINAVLTEAIPNIRKSLSPSYFSNFCTKLATEILQRYVR